MKEILIKKYIIYLFGVSIFIFVLNKLYFRPWVVENHLSGSFMIIVFSIPNLIEAIIGTLLLTGILLQLKQSFLSKLSKIKDTFIYISAMLLSSIYVISQEFKFHNIGGNNVYDFYDLIASIIGLIMTFIIIQTFGFVNHRKLEN